MKGAGKSRETFKVIKVTPVREVKIGDRTHRAIVKAIEEREGKK